MAQALPRIRTTRRPSVMGLWVLLAVCGAAPVSAQAPAVPPAGAEAADAEYQALIGAAVSEFQLGHWEEARTLFGQAHATRPSARTERGLGMVAFELRHYARSASLLREALGDPRDPLTEGLKEATEALLARALVFVGRVEVELTPADATLTLSSVDAVREADGAYLLDAGEHTLTASADGYRSESRSIDVKGGGHEVLRFTLVAPDVSPQAVAALSVGGAAAAPAGRDAAAATGDGGGSVWTKWWFWTAAAVVVGAVVVTTVVATGGDELAAPTESNTGIVIPALGKAP